jgi:type I restriction enzyme S subunit
MSRQLTRIRDLVKEVDERNPPPSTVVFSVSERHGIIPQSELFTKEIATADKSKYRRIEFGDVVFNPYLLWNCAVGVCFAKDGGCVSPAYPVLRPHHLGIERFLHYFFRSQTLTSAVDAIASGSVTRRRTAPLEEILDLAFELPSSEDQHAANKLLCLIDDRMALNRSMNATLQGLVQNLFNSKLVDVASTKLPKGWRAGTLGEVTENPRRSIQPDAIESSMAYIGLEHMPRRCMALSEWESETDLGSNKLEFKRAEILFGKLRPYFHKVGVAPLDGVCSTDILVMRPKTPEWFGFVLGHVFSVELVNHTNAASTGTKMPRANWNDIARFEVALPPDSLAAEFTATIRPMIDRIIANIHESRSLAELRDALLPKLLSGELRVPEIKKGGAA